MNKLAAGIVSVLVTCSMPGIAILSAFKPELAYATILIIAIISMVMVFAAMACLLYMTLVD